MDWREEYRRKLTTAEEAAKLVKSGDTVAIGGSSDQPRVVPPAIFARGDELEGVEIVVSNPTTNPGWFSQKVEEPFKVFVTVFIGNIARSAVREKLAQFVPHSFATCSIPYVRSGEDKPFDVHVVTVSPPNKDGFCNFGPFHFMKRDWLNAAKKVIAEVDANIKWVYGDTTVHVSEIDRFVEFTPETISEAEVANAVKGLEPEKRERIVRYAKLVMPERRPVVVAAWSNMDPAAIDAAVEGMGLVIPPAEEKAYRAVAGYVSELVKSGDCLQIGTGSPSSFLYQLGAFAGKEELGYHGEISPVGVATMVRDGQITGSRKNFMPGTCILSGCNGMSPEELEYAVENPKFGIYSSSWVLRPGVVARNDNQVAMQNCMSVDLTGQINSESVFGGMLVNGPGGQTELHIGAVFSRGGRAITMLKSTAMGGSISRIVPQLEPGTVVTIPRHLADHVVSEYGVARLMGKSERQRANELIAIAHPDFRAELRKAAEKLF